MPSCALGMINTSGSRVHSVSQQLVCCFITRRSSHAPLTTRARRRAIKRDIIMGTFHLKRLAYSSHCHVRLHIRRWVGVSAEGDKNKIAGQSERRKKKTPLVVFIESRECPVCALSASNHERTEREIRASRVHFVNLDVTDDKAKAESKQLAKTLHVADLFQYVFRHIPVRWYL